mmetsp:Transcript_57461/g.79764  ORF Transcript_57461/g.79764 Transcript_57461/m.79764 type:complete len:91 (-) Transcript_57461:328-600(-)
MPRIQSCAKMCNYRLEAVHLILRITCRVEQFQFKREWDSRGQLREALVSFMVLKSFQLHDENLWLHMDFQRFCCLLVTATCLAIVFIVPF